MAYEKNNKEARLIIKSWVEEYSNSLYSRAFYKTNHKETAEDLVQDTFLAAVQSLPNFKGESNPQTWLMAILNNKINDFYRKRFKQDTTEKEGIFANDIIGVFFNEDETWLPTQKPNNWYEDDDKHILDNLDFVSVLQNCLGSLPELWFSAIRLKYLEQENGSSICQELDISATNFWQILHRAKLQLRKCLEVKWFKQQ